MAEELGNRRLLVVATRDPAPPIFGPGFGVRESAPGRASFRWSGPSARLLVAADQGPPVATLSGERRGDAGPTRLTVREAASGRLLVERTVEPGPFDLTIAERPVYGPMAGPSEYLIACDKPVDLPPLGGATRPTRGCFTFAEATISRPPERMWMRQGARIVADLGAPDDGRYDPDGFFPREAIGDTGLDLRWSKETASVVWMPLPGFVPSRLVLRARSVAAPKDVSIFVGGSLAGALRVGTGLAEVWTSISPEAAQLLSGLEPVRIELRTATEVPKDLGKGADTRALGVGVDRIALE